MQGTLTWMPPSVSLKMTSNTRVGGFEHLNLALPDDNRFIYIDYLNCAITIMWGCKIPLRDTLDIMKRIRLTAPKAQRIWHNFSSYKFTSEAIDKTLKRETDILEKVRTGKYTLKQRLNPTTA